MVYGSLWFFWWFMRGFWRFEDVHGGLCWFLWFMVAFGGLWGVHGGLRMFMVVHGGLIMVVCGRL